MDKPDFRQTQRRLLRKRRFNRGRWNVERERHHLTEPGPPVAGHTVLIQQIVPDLLKCIGIEDQVWLQELEAIWPTLVGSAVAAHTRPGRYERSGLIVFVDNSAWLSELSRYGQKVILAKLQERFSAAKIRYLRLQLDPGEESRRPPGKAPVQST